MDEIDLAYLILVLVSFLGFAGMLFYQSQRGGRRK